MSFTAECWAWEQQCPSSSAKAVLTCLAWYANKEGKSAFPSFDTIVARTQLNARTVRKALGKLVEAKLISAHPRTTDTGRQLSTEYRLILRESAPADLPPIPPADLHEGGADLPHTPCTFAPETTKVQGNLYTELSKEEVPSLREGDTALPVPPSAVNPIEDIRKQVWDEGKALLYRLTGQGPGPAGKEIGKLLSVANKNHAIVLAAIRAAAEEMPSGDNIMGWLIAVIQKRQERRPDPNRIYGPYGASRKFRLEAEELRAREMAQ